MIDTHSHLSDEKFAGDLGGVVGRAKEAGVDKIIDPGLNITDSKRAIEIAEQFEGVYALVGVHPEVVISHPNTIVSVDELVELIESSKKVVGIGEIGLDFYWDKDKKTKKEQVELFEMQLRLAEAMKLPVMIHSRSAGEEIKEVFEGLEHLPLGQFHCFGENEKFLEYVLEKGFCVSFCGNITYKSAKDLRTLVKKVPLDRLLLETDAPYLAPGEKRGGRNEPANVRITAEFLVDVLGKSMEEIEGETTKNAYQLFGLKK